MPWILASRGLMDICLQAATALGESGLPAMHLEPSLRLSNDLVCFPATGRNKSSRSSLETAAPGTIVSWNDRPLDLSFFGTTSERRDVLMAQYLPRFEGCRDFINYVADWGVNEWMDTRVAGYVATQSKISLNIHRDDFPYFEWHRIVKQGMGSGALVVTDDVFTASLYKPGVPSSRRRRRTCPTSSTGCCGIRLANKLPRKFWPTWNSSHRVVLASNAQRQPSNSSLPTAERFRAASPAPYGGSQLVRQIAERRLAKSAV